MYVGTKILTVYFASLFVDHAGWTPLHEACNHGSTECVKALLQHCPNLQLASQVQGVSPLHDALLNHHTNIAKMLLRRGGECPTYTYIHSEIRPSQNNAYKHSMHEGSYCEYRSSHKRAENMRAHAHSRAHANVNPSTPTLKKLLNFKKVMSSLVLPGSVSHESLIQSQSNRPFYESLTCIEYHIIPYYFKTCSDSDSFVNDAEFMESNGSASLTGINKEKTFSVSMCDVSINKLMSESSRKSYYSGITCVNKQVLCRNLLNPGLSCGLTVEFYHTHT